jgi:hypothetical protein
MDGSLTIGFHRAGRDLEVAVEVGANHEPEAIGSPAEARGFPVCRATVGPPARGYVDALGWIQLVAEMDWIAASFLAEVAGERRAAALVGFTWGFRTRAEEVEIVPPTRLVGDSDWDRHRATLGAAHPTWEFEPGLGTPVATYAGGAG